MTVIYGDIGDPDTRVLQNLWKGFKPKVIHAFKDTQEDINDALQKENDILILCGHGSPSGLFGDSGYAVGFHNVELIKAKYVIGMWCHAKEFAKSAHLEGFFTAMYISNRSEALFNLKEEVTVSSAEITASETEFCLHINDMIRNSLDTIKQWPEEILKIMPPKNQVEEFNHRQVEYVYADKDYSKEHILG